MTVRERGLPVQNKSNNVALLGPSRSPPPPWGRRPWKGLRGVHEKSSIERREGGRRREGGQLRPSLPRVYKIRPCKCTGCGEKDGVCVCARRGKRRDQTIASQYHLTMPSNTLRTPTPFPLFPLSLQGLLRSERLRVLRLAHRTPLRWNPRPLPPRGVLVARLPRRHLQG